MRFPRSWSLLLLVILSFLLAGSSASAQIATCYAQGSCPTLTDLDCKPVPTSLPVVSNDPVPVGHDGFYNGPTKCGFKTCFLIFSCPCGRKLGNTICTGDDTCGGCLPPEICPQSLTLDEINKRFAEARDDVEESPTPQGTESLPLSPAPKDGSIFGVDPFVGSMLAFRDDLIKLEDLYVRASTYVHLLEDGRPVGRGTFEFWAAGERFYVRAQADRHLGLGHDIEASFDGNEARLLLIENSLLIRNTGSPTAVNLPFPSPLQVPFFFLNAAECPTCIGALKEVVDPTTWSSVFDGVKTKAGGLWVRGPMMEGTGATYFSIWIGDHGVANRIEWKTVEDDLLATAEMRNFRDVTGLGAFPTNLTLTAFDDFGQPMARIFYRIDEIRANTGSHDLGFRVSEDRAEMVWENQERRFSKHFDAAGSE